LCAVGYLEATLEALLIIRDVGVVVVAESADKFENLATDVNKTPDWALRAFGAGPVVASSLLVNCKVIAFGLEIGQS